MQNNRLFFNPKNLLNPGKIFPQPGLCVEVKKDARGLKNKILDKPKVVTSKSGIMV